MAGDVPDSEPLSPLLKYSIIILVAIGFLSFLGLALLAILGSENPTKFQKDFFIVCKNLLTHIATAFAGVISGKAL